jgi:hypothetical protein
VLQASELEHHLQSKLYLPREIRVRGESEVGVAKKRVQWLIQVGVIEDIEALGAELEVHPLRDLDILEEGKINLTEVRAPEGIASQISVEGRYARGGAGVDVKGGR